MTASEYIQLKAFARQEGVLLCLLWTASFACYVMSMSRPSLSVPAMLLIVGTPFYVAWRLRSFRDQALSGSISFLRAWAFVILMFFYASILFALVQYAYFRYMDHGALAEGLRHMMELPENKAMMEQMGVTNDMQEALTGLQKMRPIDTALNIMTTNIFIGMAVGVPIAMILKKMRT